MTADRPLAPAQATSKPTFHMFNMVLFALPAGGFVTLALLLAGINHLQAVVATKKGKPAPAPLEFDCRHCTMCKKFESIGDS